jgi:hypothetical protein
VFGRPHRFRSHHRGFSQLRTPAPSAADKHRRSQITELASPSARTPSLPSIPSSPVALASKPTRIVSLLHSDLNASHVGFHRPNLKCTITATEAESAPAASPVAPARSDATRVGRHAATAPDLTGVASTQQYRGVLSSPPPPPPRADRQIPPPRQSKTLQHNPRAQVQASILSQGQRLARTSPSARHRNMSPPLPMARSHTLTAPSRTSQRGCRGPLSAGAGHHTPQTMQPRMRIHRRASSPGTSS